MNPSSFKESGGGGGSGETTAKMDLLELKLGFGSSSSSLPLSSPTPAPALAPAPAPAPAVVERYNNGLWWAHNHKQLGLFVSRDSSSDEYEYDCCLPSSPLLGTLFWSAFPCNDGSHQYYHCSQPVVGLWFSLRSIINRYVFLWT